MRGNAQYFPYGLDPLWAGMTPEPYGPQAERGDGDQDILGRRGAVLNPVVRCLVHIPANSDGGAGLFEHLPVGMGFGKSLQDFPAPYNHEMSRPAVLRGRRCHGRPEDLVNLFLLDRLVGIGSYASSREDRFYRHIKNSFPSRVSYTTRSMSRRCGP